MTIGTRVRRLERESVVAASCGDNDCITCQLARMWATETGRAWVRNCTPETKRARLIDIIRSTGPDP